MKSDKESRKFRKPSPLVQLSFYSDSESTAAQSANIARECRHESVSEDTEPKLAGGQYAFEIFNRFHQPVFQLNGRRPIENFFSF